MICTKHMTQRMQQRCISMPIVECIFEQGQADINGEKISISNNEIKKHISEIEFQINKLKKYRKILEKLKHRGGATLVIDNNSLITAYYKI